MQVSLDSTDNLSSDLDTYLMNVYSRVALPHETDKT